MKEKHKMKIAFFDLAGPNFPGGCEKYFATLARHFSSNNKTFFFHSTEFSRFMEYVYHFLAGHKVGSIQFNIRDIGKTDKFDIKFSSMIPFSRDNNKINGLLKDMDIIYTKNEFQELMILYLLLGKKRFSQKVIIGVHSAIFLPDSIKGIWRFVHDIEYKSYWYRIFLQSAKSIHVINSDYKVLLVDKYAIRKEKVVYIPYFIDWKTTLMGKRKGGKFTILWAGRLTQQKGVDRLKKIIKILSKNKDFNKLMFLIAGSGEDLIGNLLREHRNIEFLGYVKDMEQLYKQIDLAVVTSYFETFGYNVLEPQSFGVPVIAFNIEGPKDIIFDKKTGYLVKSNKEFVEKIEGLFRKKDRLLSKKSIYEEINRKFSKTEILERMKKELFDTI